MTIYSSTGQYTPAGLENIRKTNICQIITMKPSGSTLTSSHPNIPLEISNYLILPLLLPPPPTAIKITYPTDNSQECATPTTNSPKEAAGNSKATTAPTKTETAAPKASTHSLSRTYHYLYFQPHSPRLPHPDTPRSLYAVNIPIDATEAGIRALFAEQLGGWRVERVRFEDEDEDGDDGLGGDKDIDTDSKGMQDGYLFHVLSTNKSRVLTCLFGSSWSKYWWNRRE